MASSETITVNSPNGKGSKACTPGIRLVLEGKPQQVEIHKADVASYPRQEIGQFFPESGFQLYFVVRVATHARPNKLRGCRTGHVFLERRVVSGKVMLKHKYVSDNHAHISDG